MIGLKYQPTARLRQNFEAGLWRPAENRATREWQPHATHQRTSPARLFNVLCLRSLRESV